MPPSILAIRQVCLPTPNLQTNTWTRPRVKTCAITKTGIQQRFVFRKHIQGTVQDKHEGRLSQCHVPHSPAEYSPKRGQPPQTFTSRTKKIPY